MRPAEFTPVATLSEPLVVDIPEAARKLGVSRTLAYRLIRAGDLKVVKIGSRSLIAQDELRRFVVSRAAAA